MSNCAEKMAIERCLEIIETDKEFAELNNIITYMEKELRKTLTPMQQKILNKIDNMKEQYLCELTSKIYIAGSNDRIKQF